MLLENKESVLCWIRCHIGIDKRLHLDRTYFKIIFSKGTLVFQNCSRSGFRTICQEI